jgi:predicted alpha/beta superfamily hydrolase
MRWTAHSILAIALLFSMIASACELPSPAERAVPDDQAPGPLVTSSMPSPIPTTRTFDVCSPKIDGSYHIYVQLPSDYDQTDPQGYTTLYLLDGDWYFDGSSPRIGGSGVQGIVSDLVETGKIPPCILVGIGYVGRNRRYEFTQNFRLFHSFLVEELIPTIDANFPTDPSAGRTLIGHSDGAYFTLFTLFVSNAQQWPFQRFIAISGDYTKNNRHIFKEESQFNERVGSQDGLNSALFMAVGGYEEGRFVHSNEDIASIISSREYEGFRFVSLTEPGLNHRSILTPALREGLLWVYEEADSTAVSRPEP